MDKITQDINDLITFMRQKGYDGNFTLDADGLTKVLTGDLRSVLTALSKHASEQGIPMGSFVLSTFAQYINYQEYIKTQFYTRHETDHGFIISQQHSSHNAQYPTKIHLVSHHQVIGRHALINRYPKPIRRDDPRRGRRNGPSW